MWLLWWGCEAKNDVGKVGAKSCRLLSDVLRNFMGAEKPSKVPESLHRTVLKDSAQSPMTEDTTRNLLEKAKKACVGELMWERC